MTNAQSGEAAEIALARSAAPDLISKDATVYVLRRGDYVKAAAGTNGFACLVVRDEDPRASYPTCLDPEWTRVALPAYQKEAEMRARGANDEKIAAEIARLRQNKRLPSPAKSGVAYMASPRMRGMFDVIEDGFIQPHVMIYARGATNAQLGIKDIREARRRHIPFVAEEGRPTAHIISPLMTYSDGTPFKDQ